MTLGPSIPKRHQQGSNEIIPVTAEEFDYSLTTIYIYLSDQCESPVGGGKGVMRNQNKIFAAPRYIILTRPSTKSSSIINRHCPELLREIGRPAKLEPFHIDTGDHALRTSTLA